VEEDDDVELDSLDSHLHAFRPDDPYHQSSSPTNLDASAAPILPSHNGLGSFHIDNILLNERVQEHIYAFEQYNPRRVKRRRESLDLGGLELEAENTVEDDRTRRIEEWRVEQSRALLEEIQRETRRRKRSISTRKSSVSRDLHEEESVTMGSVHIGGEGASNAAPKEESDGFWTRVTRRVIQDLMGIDDRLLSIIFGESLPEEFEQARRAPAAPAATNAEADESWELRLLERIARELGSLVNQLSEHPGAFSTYLKVSTEPLPYAGLPIIPETADTVEPSPVSPQPSASTPLFHPTIPPMTNPIDIAASSHHQPQSAPEIDIDATPRANQHGFNGAPEDSNAHRERGFTKEEWERQLDIKLVFDFLRSRFSSRPANTTYTPSASRATTSPSDAAARAARVRQHHPLVTGHNTSRPRATERRPSFKLTLAGSPVQRRRGSSCASQSTKKSWGNARSGSSRHYWDFGGSACGSGSLRVSTGGMGAWGDL
jgi:hypothetical protein